MEFRLTRKMARTAIVFIWLIAIGIMTPWAVYYEQHDMSTSRQTIYTCLQMWPSRAYERGYFLGAIFLTCYTIPLVFISCCYTMIGYRVVNRNAPGMANTCQVIQRSKVKVLKMLIMVVILFALSWLPLYAITIRTYFGSEVTSDSVEFKLLYMIILPVSQWLGSSNSCVNPIIYCFFSKKFRRGFKDMVSCCDGRGSSYMNRNNSAAYRTMMDGNGHVMTYTSIRSNNTTETRRSVRGSREEKNSDRKHQSRDYKNEVTFV